MSEAIEGRVLSYEYVNTGAQFESLRLEIETGSIDSPVVMTLELNPTDLCQLANKINSLDWLNRNNISLGGLKELTPYRKAWYITD